MHHSYNSPVPTRQPKEKMCNLQSLTNPETIVNINKSIVLMIYKLTSLYWDTDEESYETFD